MVIALFAQRNIFSTHQHYHQPAKVLISKVCPVVQLWNLFTTTKNHSSFFNPKENACGNCLCVLWLKLMNEWMWGGNDELSAPVTAEKEEREYEYEPNLEGRKWVSNANGGGSFKLCTKRMERRRKTRPSKFVNYNRLPLLIAPLYLSFWLQLGDHPICRGMKWQKEGKGNCWLILHHHNN